MKQISRRNYYYYYYYYYVQTNLLLETRVVSQKYKSKDRNTTVLAPKLKLSSWSDEKACSF
jgi:hypothetical protein